MGNPITDIQEMWDAAITHKQAGHYDTQAMYDIYKRMDPSLGYQDIANVMSGVYADTYWSGVILDSGKLAADMVTALELGSTEASKYASNAIKTWRGVYCRDRASDTGMISRPTYTCASIDISCTGNASMNTDDLIKNWNNVYWNAPVVGKNYIYVRCQNDNFLGTTNKNTVKLFYTYGGFNQPPSTWTPVPTAKCASDYTADVLTLGGNPEPLETNAKGVSEAFLFQPKSVAHVCMAAVVCSDYFKTNDPSKYKGSNWNTQTWIYNNGAAAWHNADPQISNASTLKFYNQDSRPEIFAFEAHCNKVPVGTKVTLASKDNSLKLESSDKIANTYQVIGTEAVIPANYEGDLEVIIETPDGSLLPEGASVEVKMLWVLDRGHQSYMAAANMHEEHESARVARNIRVPMGSFSFMGVKK